MKKKYDNWGEFLKSKREEKFRSARDFCAKMAVGISYPQYSRYEAGDQLPNLEQALLLCRFLDIPMLDGLLEWCRAQVLDASLKASINELVEKISQTNGSSESGPGGIGKNQEVAKQVSLDDVIVFNRSHLKLFSSNPAYRDIFTYVNSFSPEWISAEEISEALNIVSSELEQMLEQLNDLGVILVAGGKCRSSKRNFYFPDDIDFFPLRNANVMHNVSSIIGKITHDDLQDRTAFRGLVTRELNQEQLNSVVGQAENLVAQVVSMPETPQSDKIYSVCLLVGQRFARPSEKVCKRTETPKPLTANKKKDESQELIVG